jgi:hypothetical protein
MFPLVGSGIVPVAATQALALLILFVLLPFVVAGLVIAFISWRSNGQLAPVRTSTVLAEGDPAEAEVLTVKAMGGFLDTRPMVRLDLHVRGDEYDLQVTQSIPRALLRDLKVGDVVEVRVMPDHATGAVLLGPPPPPA